VFADYLLNFVYHNSHILSHTTFLLTDFKTILSHVTNFRFGYMFIMISNFSVTPFTHVPKCKHHYYIDL